MARVYIAIAKNLVQHHHIYKTFKRVRPNLYYQKMISLRSTIPTIPTLLILLLSSSTSYYHHFVNAQTTGITKLGPWIPVTLNSNQTLTFIQEYSSPSDRISSAANGVIQEPFIDENKIRLQFDVCFDPQYCSTVSTNQNQFVSTLSTNVCGSYCQGANNIVQYESNVEVLDVCNNAGINVPTIATKSGYTCINMAITIQASNIIEANNIYTQLQDDAVSTKTVWRTLFTQLIPNFPPADIFNADIAGNYITLADPATSNETWYPEWHDDIQLCSNDPKNQPGYMSTRPDEYLSSNMVDCCRKHYWWMVRECADPSNRPCPDGYVVTAEEMLGVMNGMYYGEYPNIFYSGW